MTALSKDTNRTTREGVFVSAGVKASSVIYAGSVVVLLAGVAIAGRAATTRAELSTMIVAGVAAGAVTGGAADGDETVTIDRRPAKLANSSSGDALTAADIGSLCFLADDNTVAKTIGGGARPIAGEVMAVDTDGVWVDFTKACSPRRIYLQAAINETDTLAGTSAELVSPVVGAITQMQTIVQKAVTTGGDVTAAVGTTAVVGLACTIADAATKGSVVTDTPTLGDATTIVAVGSRIQVAPAAAFNSAGAVTGLVEITY